MKSYQRFFRDAGQPIGFTVAIIFICLFVYWILGAMCVALSPDPDLAAARDTYRNECVLAGGEVMKRSGSQLCVKIEQAEGIPLENSWESAYDENCHEADGEILFNYQKRGCYTVTVIEELGARP